MFDVPEVLDAPLYIHVNVVLIIKNFVFLKYISMYNNLSVLILLFSIAKLPLLNIVTILAVKQIYKKTIN